MNDPQPPHAEQEPSVALEDRLQTLRSENGDAISLMDIFLCFLIIGGTSFGGGIVAYLRSGLVSRRKWIDDDAFLELLSICQSLPGLNASNMAILVGDRLRGSWGAVVALVGICLPGAVLMVGAAIAYAAIQGKHPGIAGALLGVSAAAVGLVLAVTYQVGSKTMTRWTDFLFAGVTVVGVAYFHQSVLVMLVLVGLCAIFWYRPGHLPPKKGRS